MNPQSIPDLHAGADPFAFIGRVVRIPTRMIKQLPGQPRTFFDATQMQRLLDSISEIGQQQPATVVPWTDGTFRLRDGERRWRSCVELQRPLLALVAEPKTAEEEFELSAAANMNRESHSPLEKALAMKRLRDGRLKRSIAEIARTFGVTSSTVASHLLVLDQLPQEIVDLMDPNKQGARARTLQISAAVRLTALREHPRAQLRIANRIVRDNLSLSAAVRMIDEFADNQQISSGRGRERKASDHLELLLSALRRLGVQVEYFTDRTQVEVDKLFEYMPQSRHDEVRDELTDMIAALTAIGEKISAVQGVGSRRSAAA